MAFARTGSTRSRPTRWAEVVQDADSLPHDRCLEAVAARDAPIATREIVSLEATEVAGVRRDGVAE